MLFMTTAPSSAAGGAGSMASLGSFVHAIPDVSSVSLPPPPPVSSDRTSLATLIQSSINFLLYFQFFNGFGFYSRLYFDCIITKL